MHALIAKVLLFSFKTINTSWMYINWYSFHGIFGDTPSIVDTSSIVDKPSIVLYSHAVTIRQLEYISVWKRYINFTNMNYTVNDFLFGDYLVCKIDEILMQKKSFTDQWPRKIRESTIELATKKSMCTHEIS